MKNRLPKEDLSALYGSLNLSKFMSIPDMEKIYRVFHGLILRSGWDTIPEEKQYMVEIACPTFMHKAWRNVFGQKTPWDIEPFDMASIMTSLFQNVIDEVIEDFASRQEFRDFWSIWPSVEAMQAPWRKAIKDAAITSQGINKATEAIDRAYAATNDEDALKTKLEVFTLYRKVSRNTSNSMFHYLGNHENLDTAKIAVMNATAEMTNEGDEAPKLFFFGELSDSGKKVLELVITEAAKTGKIDKGVYGYADTSRPISVFGQDLIIGTERSSLMVQAAQIAHSALLLANSMILKRLDAVTQSLLTVLLSISHNTAQKSPLEAGAEIAEKIAHKDNSKLDQFLTVHTWFHDTENAELALLKLVRTPDGPALVEAKVPEGAQFAFATKDAITPTVWNWADKLTQQDPVYLKLTKDYDLVSWNELTGEITSTVEINIPFEEDQEIF